MSCSSCTILKVSKILKSSPNYLQINRYVTKCARKGLVVGVYTNKNKEHVFTNTGKTYNEKAKGQLLDQLNIGKSLDLGDSRIFWNLDNEYKAVCVVGLGSQEAKKNPLEELDEAKEAVRVAAAVGCKSLSSIGCDEIKLEDLGDAEAAAEGATLGTFVYQELKNKLKQKPQPKINLESDGKFDRGLIKACAQNFARQLTDTPANLMTPTIFAKKVEEAVKPYGVTVEAHDRKWIENEKMGAFLSVTNGSDEPPIFLELTYQGAGKEDPCVLVGKGITFDSGGISIKPSAVMDHMRGDMGGAACVVSTIMAVAQMKLPINLKGLTPLCENLPSGKATKPGDVVVAKNGKTICVDNTDAEGRLVLADALCYAAKFKPKWVVDLATLTGAMHIALGRGAAGVFSNSDSLWQTIHQAGHVTGDRVWRFPLWKCYTDRMCQRSAYDINNISDGKGGGACTAAAFLREFIPENTDWMHIDIAGVMGPGDDISYLKEGMTGRPTRTLIQFIEQLSTKKC